MSGPTGVLMRKKMRRPKSMHCGPGGNRIVTRHVSARLPAGSPRDGRHSKRHRDRSGSSARACPLGLRSHDGDHCSGGFELARWQLVESRPRAAARACRRMVTPPTEVDSTRHPRSVTDLGFASPRPKLHHTQRDQKTEERGDSPTWHGPEIDGAGFDARR